MKNLKIHIFIFLAQICQHFVGCDKSCYWLSTELFGIN